MALLEAFAFIDSVSRFPLDVHSGLPLGCTEVRTNAPGSSSGSLTWFESVFKESRLFTCSALFFRIAVPYYVSFSFQLPMFNSYSVNLTELVLAFQERRRETILRCPRQIGTAVIVLYSAASIATLSGKNWQILKQTCGKSWSTFGNSL